MKKGKDIFGNITTKSVVGTMDKPLSIICFDSREVSENSLFVALKGTLSDGHQFIDKAIDKGAIYIVCEQMPKTQREGVAYIQVEDSHKALAELSANFYGNPSEKLKLVGVTGTNGKTTIATLLYQLFTKAGYKVGLLSTVKVMVGSEEFKATHTTPDSITINKYLSKMVEEGCEFCFMEVSSHGIHQKRTESLHFAGGIFTNLTHDHLDYHKSFAEYRDVKKSFFDNLPKSAFALVNIDDKNGSVMLQNTKAKKQSYALKTLADFKAKIVENQLSGLFLNIQGYDVYTRLIGSFNAYNILAVYATSILLGIDEIQTLTIISELKSIAGRFQLFNSKDGIKVIVDYAHTPDALKNVLQTINDIRTGNEEVITVVGCGGDRDKTKRPKMGHIASQLSTQVIFTSDNPRSEDPRTIIAEIEQGVEPQNVRKTLAITDREQAIRTAVKIAQPNDVILIAGKGHENYQEINGERHHFDDMEEVQKFFRM
ncbi:MAG: UDP-N-acetylmuramoyl-L-alanyl-D-glutamate--2,6-diaminopimelate ligase [Flavobacteriaceae bacterium]|nr:UDP-N-acetylmuramoyl-L-alanyl-D-glutamate--2,6-diaminopimelate ligase [Flavobacteriaceae bacterium]